MIDCKFVYSVLAYLGSGTRPARTLSAFSHPFSFSPFSADYKIYDRICHVQNIISGNAGSDGDEEEQRWSSSLSSCSGSTRERSMSQTLTTT